MNKFLSILKNLNIENSMKISNCKLKIRAAERGFIRLTKKTLILILTLMAWVILASAEAAWYDDNWAYRQGEKLCLV